LCFATGGASFTGGLLTWVRARRRIAMRPIPVGAKGSFTLLVEPAHLANRFKDAMLPPVLATPVMIMVMENAALNAIRPYLDPGESAVGTAVDIRHLAATPLGRLVTGAAEVTRVDGRQVEFAVCATEGAKEVGIGTHRRAVIDLGRFAERLRRA
jgi:fluoroacetyl-CoA thioesterase